MLDFEEEHLDFEPDFEDEFDGSSENQSKLVPQLDFYSDQSTMKDFNLNCQDVDSNYSTTVKNYSDSNVSIAHIR